MLPHSPQIEGPAPRLATPDVAAIYLVFRKAVRPLDGKLHDRCARDAMKMLDFAGIKGWHIRCDS